MKTVHICGILLFLILELNSNGSPEIHNHSTNISTQATGLSFEEIDSKSCRIPSLLSVNITTKRKASSKLEDEENKIKFYLTNIIKTLNVSKSCSLINHCYVAMVKRRIIAGATKNTLLPGSNSSNNSFGKSDCIKDFHLSICGVSLNISNQNQCNLRHKEFLSSTEENMLALFCILIDTDHIISRALDTSNNCTQDVIKCNCNSILSTLETNETKKKATEIDKNLQEKFDKEITNMCYEFEVGEDECSCISFRIQTKNKTVELCDVINNRNVLLNYNGIKSGKTWVRNIAEYSCKNFYLSESECKCEMLFAVYQNQSKDLCAVEIGGPLIFENLQQLCAEFGIPPTACSCKIFSFKEEDPKYKSFCQLHESLNSTITVVKFNPYYSLPFAIIGTLASIIGIVGNGLVIIMAFRFRRSLPRCKKLFAHLAICDFTFAILQLINFVPKFWDSRWIYGTGMCKMLKSTELLGSMVAIGIVLIISIERFIGILEPFQRGLSQTLLISLLCLNILIALLSVIPLLHYYEIDRVGLCRILWPDFNKYSVIYDSYNSFVYFIIPLIAITYLYTRIVLNLRGTVTFGNSNWIADPRLRRKRINDNRRTMYMLLAVVIAFVLLVLPYHFVILYLDAHDLNGEYIPTEAISMTTYIALVYFAFLPYPFHVAINPIIYCLLDTKWRRDVLNLLLMIPSRARAYSNTFSTSIRATTRRQSSGMVIDRSPEDFRLPYLTTYANCRRQTIEIEVSPLPTPLSIRQKHLSDSSGKSIESDCYFHNELQDPF